MQLGILTAPFPDTPLDDVADWASGAGFTALEIACWPRSSGATRRYAGTSHIDVANLSASRGEGHPRGAARKRASSISALGYYPNPLHPDASAPRGGHRPPQAGDHAAAARWASGWSTPSAAATPAKTLDDNWAEAEKSGQPSSPTPGTMA